MKIAILDDLHLEFGAYQELLPDADVLVLAGDICVAAYLSPHRTDAEARAHRKNCSEFFQNVSEKYSNVLYVMGNHEHYRSVFEETRSTLEEFLSPWPNIRLMDNSTIIIDDVLFFGATMWTSCNNANPITCNVLRNYLTDFRVIKRTDGGLFTPEASAFEHEKTLLSLTSTIATSGGQKMVVITHHCPSELSLDPQFKNETEGNFGFASRLDNVMCAHPQICAWFHGHVHRAVDYMINKTRVVANPRGYPGEQRWQTTKFDPAKVVEV